MFCVVIKSYCEFTRKVLDVDDIINTRPYPTVERRECSVEQPLSIKSLTHSHRIYISATCIIKEIDKLSCSVETVYRSPSCECLLYIASVICS